MMVNKNDYRRKGRKKNKIKPAKMGPFNNRTTRTVTACYDKANHRGGFDNGAGGSRPPMTEDVRQFVRII